MAKAHQVSIPISDLLSETHFEFAIKCLKNVMHIKKSENFVFSPYSIYEGLLLTYFASREDTELWLKRILLYENFPPKLYLLHDVAMKMDKKLPNCYEKNSCWITNSIGCINKKMELLFTDELKLVPFDENSINLKNWINKLLSIKTQKYIHKPVKLDIIGKNLEIILTTVLGFTGMAYQKNVAANKSNTHKKHLVKEPKTVLSHNLGMLVTELPYVNKTLSLFLLFPATPDLTTEKWRINEDITGLIKD
ncbi:serpin B5-like [Nylanderia fulva]|uniref:serpin B5-like n=1 Tax=Nylanderia fulva TaxID=613905 RepID=UPI0010FAEF37|nr:serpin B5-like [Nylanderia fulva]